MEGEAPPDTSISSGMTERYTAPDHRSSFADTIRGLRDYLTRMSERRRVFEISFILHLLLFFMTVMASGTWGLFHLLAAADTSVFLLCILSALGSGFITELYSKGKGWTLLVLFLLPLITQLLLLLEDPNFSQDILRLQFRGEALREGLIPYRDFEVNKPPLYVWMVGLVSTLFGSSPISFRAMFVVFNSLIPPLMHMIGERSDDENLSGFGWRTGAFAYALWPLAFLEVGLSGHFDPVVVVLVLLAYMGLVSGRTFSSGVFLGAGFALKMFPLFLIPIFFLGSSSRRSRWMLLPGFISVPLLSTLPFMISDPDGILEYLSYQSSGWGVSLSLRYVLDLGLSVSGIPLITSFLLSIAVFAAGWVLMVISGMRGSGRSVTPVLLGLAFLSIVPTGSTVIVILADTTGPLISAAGVLSILVSLAFILLSFRIIRTSRRDAGPKRQHHTMRWLIPRWNLPSTIAMVILLLLLVSAQFHPWYLMWAAPFVFASGGRTAWSFLLLSGPLQYNAYFPWDLGTHF